MRIEWTPEALAELETILNHLPPEIATNTAERIVQAEKNTVAFPKSALYHEDLDVYERYIPKTRVILIYHVKDQIIEIISAFHTSRDPAEK